MGRRASMAEPIRVLVVDDHEIVREGMRLLLSEEAELELVGQAATAKEALTQTETLQPEVVLMDLMLPDSSGIEVTRELRQRFPATQVIMLTGSFGDDLRVREALQAGAIGYLLKDVMRADLVAAIKRAASGKATLHPEAQEQLLQVAVEVRAAHLDLTDRELEVLCLIGKGNSNKKIATLLSLSEGTVKGYVSIILDKLGVADRTQAALYAVKHGLVSN
jgi:DNA-binding NarL/FixJ family response regulator